MSQNGIDVSSHQGVIRWDRVAADGVQFAMLRAGYGWQNPETQTDTKFYANVNGAEGAGIPIGCYLYSYATTPEEAKLEARFLQQIISGIPLEYPVAYDVEDICQRNLSRSRLTDVVVSFCTEMERAGYYPALYTNLDWIRNRLDMQRLQQYDLWLAQYNSSVTYDGPYGMWQKSNSGKINGISGNVDLDIAYKDYPTLIQAAGLNNLAVPGSGSLLLDTKWYTMPPGSVYDVRATLKGASLQNMKVYSSRDGIASVTPVPGTDKYRIRALRDGVTYIMFVVNNADGLELNHASVKIIVQSGVRPHGESNSTASIF